MKQRIREELGLTCAFGIASNKLLSKIASDLNKPDGLTVINDSEKVALLRSMPVRKLFGVGEVTEQALANVGRTIGDLQNYRGDLRPIAGSFATQLKQFAFGIDERPLNLNLERKSISSEETFLEDTDDTQTIMQILWQQATELEAKLRENEKDAYTVAVRVRYSDFTTLSRQTTVADPIHETGELYILAFQLLRRHKLLGRPIRLIGLEVSSLRPSGVRQLRLF